MFLSKYHSDMRWQVKTYMPEKLDKYRFSKRLFKNEKMVFFDVNGMNVVVYGVNAHKSFYAMWDNEEYHEFDNVKVK